MKYKTIPNTTIEIPDYMAVPASSAGVDINLLARNAEIVRRIKAIHFGKTDSRSSNNTANLNATLTLGGAR